MGLPAEKSEKAKGKQPKKPTTAEKLRTVTWNGEAGSSAPTTVGSTSVDNTSELPLSKDEIALFRQQLREGLNKGTKITSNELKRFKVPTKHPIFDGRLEKLEEFISSMMLTHMEWVTGDQARAHCPKFITKLVDYFDEKSGARLWFSNYATERLRAEKVLSWSRLVRDLRRDFHQSKQQGALFSDFYFLEQGADDIQIYVAKFKNAVQQAKSLITEALMIMVFTAGLREETQRQVNPLEPKTIEAAIKLAIQFEGTNASLKPKARKASTTKAVDESKPVKRKTDEMVASGKAEKRRKIAMEIRESQAGVCFECGEAGHMKDSCQATTEARAKHKKKIYNLKAELGRIK